MSAGAGPIRAHDAWSHVTTIEPRRRSTGPYESWDEQPGHTVRACVHDVHRSIATPHLGGTAKLDHKMWERAHQWLSPLTARVGQTATRHGCATTGGERRRLDRSRADQDAAGVHSCNARRHACDAMTTRPITNPARHGRAGRGGLDRSQPCKARRGRPRETRPITTLQGAPRPPCNEGRHGADGRRAMETRPITSPERRACREASRRTAGLRCDGDSADHQSWRGAPMKRAAGEAPRGASLTSPSGRGRTGRRGGSCPYRGWVTRPSRCCSSWRRSSFATYCRGRAAPSGPW